MLYNQGDNNNDKYYHPALNIYSIVISIHFTNEYIVFVYRKQNTNKYLNLYTKYQYIV